MVGTGLVGRKAPVDGCSLGVAFSLPGRHFRTYRGCVWQPAIQALPGQDGELDFCHVEPTAVLGRVVKLELANDAAGFGRLKRFVKCGWRVRIQIVKGDPNELGIREVQIDQVFHTLSKVGFGTLVGYLNMPPAHMRLHKHEQVASVFAFVLVVITLRPPRFAWQRLPRFADQLVRALVKADPWPFGVFRLGI